jgi:alpha-L-rhamnosidase
VPDQRQQILKGQATPTPLTLSQLRSGFADPPRRAAPGMRWWWFGPSVIRPELERELRVVADAGLSGVEVAFVYPLGEATTAFCSETFLEDLRFAAELAHRLGLRFELTLGSGWSFGGPHISTELAARQLHWEQRQIGSEALQVPVAWPRPGDDLVAAYLGAGSLQEPPVSYERLPLLNGQLRIEAGTGPRVVLLAYGRLTGQQVKRAAAGAEGPVLDHYSATATEAHLRAVADPMLDAVPATLVDSVFCDSLEAYESDWTPALPAEFAQRRGYDLLPELYRLVVDGPDAATVRADYHRTLSELYQENFVAVCQRWATARGVPFRIQSYGTPPATISSYRFADLFEGEGWGWRDILPTRWASSAAHLYGCATVSAEAWTWVHSPSYRATPLDLKGEAHEHLLNGVNRLIGHGWPYSPKDAPGMGWFFYAAGALDDRNPWWPAMPGLARYLGRLCWLLQQGEPVADVALYVPNQDLFATMGRAQGGSLDAWREAARRIPPAIPAVIRMAGWDYDLIDDEALAVTTPDRYRVVIVPATTMLLDLTRNWLDEVAGTGGSLITVDSSVELPAAVAVTADRLADVLLAAVAPDLEISPPSPGIGFVHRRCPDCEVYFLVNTGPAIRTFSVLTRTSAASYEQWDPASGRVLAAGPAAEPIGLELHPYQATVLVLHDQPVQPVSPRALAERRLPLNHWQVAFPDEPVRQVHLPHVWEDQPGREHYSGAATYTTSIELASAVDQAEIDFGECEVIEDDSATHGMVGPSYRVAVRAPVGEIAAVRVNSIDCGLAWAPPYRVDVSGALRRGSNDIQVMICNTGANAVAADEHIRRLAADSEARYGRRFRMQDLDQAMATVRSGLLQKPALVIADDRATEG